MIKEKIVDKAALPKPVINMNGNSKEALTKQLQDIWSALDDSIKVIKEGYPHGRDYQTYITETSGVYPDELKKAQDWYDEQIKTVHDVQANFLAVYKIIEKQGK